MIAQGSQRLAAVNSLSLLILGTVVLVADILTSNAHFVPRDSAHCIVWRTWQRESQHDNSATRDATSPSDIFQAFEALEAGGAPLCRLSPINHGYHATGSRANSFDDLMPPNMVIPIGVLDPVSGMCTFEGQENSTGHVEIATTDPSCDVWWRTVTSDVMPPMTEMAMQFAMSALSQPRNSRDEKELQIMFGICRSPMSETERPRLGTLILNGRDVGHCVIPEGTGGSTTVLVGGGYDIVQAREGFAGGCEDDPLEASSRAAELDSHFRQFISDEDRIMLESVTGHDSHALEAAILRLGSCDLRQVMSSARFVPHELNHQGLTLLRHVLAERMYDARQAALGSHLHPDFEQWRRDGILVKKLDQLSDEDVLGLLRMVSGEHSLGIPTKVEWSPRFTVHAPGDPQYETHIDNAVGPIFKAWVYPSNMTIADGPLYVSRGSHRNSLAKLRWMHSLTVPPAEQALKEPALRLFGDPTALGFKALEPVLPLEGAERTLLLVDTSALHRRGQALPGTRRLAWRLAGDNAGGLPRLDPFRSINILSGPEREL